MNIPSTYSGKGESESTKNAPTTDVTISAADTASEPAPDSMVAPVRKSAFPPYPLLSEGVNIANIYKNLINGRINIQQHPTRAHPGLTRADISITARPRGDTAVPGHTVGHVAS